jgi:hypothetical protein
MQRGKYVEKNMYDRVVELSESTLNASPEILHLCKYEIQFGVAPNPITLSMRDAFTIPTSLRNLRMNIKKLLEEQDVTWEVNCNSSHMILVDAKLDSYYKYVIKFKDTIKESSKENDCDNELLSNADNLCRLINECKQCVKDERYIDALSLAFYITEKVRDLQWNEYKEEVIKKISSDINRGRQSGMTRSKKHKGIRIKYLDYCRNNPEMSSVKWNNKYHEMFNAADIDEDPVTSTTLRRWREKGQIKKTN